MVRSALLVLLVLLVPSVGALAAQLGVTASSTAAGVRVDVSSTAATNVTVLITHEDPLVGTVIDRVVPVALVEGSARLDLSGLPSANFSIRVLNATTPLPTLSAATQLLNATRAIELPTIANVTRLTTPTNATTTHAFRAYPILQGQTWGDTFLMVRDSGLVLLGTPVLGEAGHDANLTLYASRDGGRTFEAPVTITGPFPNGGGAWRWDGARSGPLTIYHVKMRWISPDGFAEDGIRYIRYDPEGARELGSGTLTDKHYWSYAAAPLPDGASLFVGHGAMAPNEYDPEHTIQLSRVARDGTITQLGSVHAFANRSGVPDVHVQTSRGGTVVLGWEENKTFLLARSFDGGLTLSDPTPISGPANIDARMIDLARPDETGTVHAIVTLPHPTRDETVNGTHYYFANYSTYYARWPAVGPLTVTPVNGEWDAGALVPSSHRTGSAVIVANGPRVWIVWTTTGEGFATYGLESVDGGLTFAAPYRLSATVDGWSIAGVMGTSLFPDGRPLLLAGIGYGVFDVPLFDPLADEASGLTHVTTFAVQAPTPPPKPADPTAARPTQATPPDATTSSTPVTTSPPSTPTDGSEHPVPGAALVLLAAAVGLVTSLRRRP